MFKLSALKTEFTPANKPNLSFYNYAKVKGGFRYYYYQEQL